MAIDRSRQEARGLLAEALAYLTRQGEEHFREALHVLPFPRSQGFVGPRDEQEGDVFARALVVDALADAVGLAEPPPTALIEREVDYLISRRSTDGVGGWRYFPELVELPPDADDLAQVMLALVRAGRRADAAEHCEPPLRVLLTENSHADGSFETWIVPRQPGPEQQLQIAWIRQAWGWGPDPEVIGNLLHALLEYDPARFGPTAEHGAAYLAAVQRDDGSWPSTWYHGPFYGTWICLRLFRRLGGRAEAVRRGRDFVAACQMSDGGWGWDGQSDPLSTALAILALWTPTSGCAEPNGPGPEALAAALRRLAAQRDADDGWPSVPFIRMELGRPTGRPWQVLSHGSRVITSALVLKASSQALRSLG